MHFYRAFRDIQFTGDHFIRLPLSNQFQYIALTRGKAVDIRLIITAHLTQAGSAASSGSLSIISPAESILFVIVYLAPESSSFILIVVLAGKLIST